MKKRSFINDFMAIGLSKIGIIIFSLLTSVITARVLGPEKNGIISSILVYPSILLSLGSLGISQSTTYLLGKSVYPEVKLKKAITQLWLMTSIISIVTCLVLMKILSNANYLYILFVLIPVPFVLFNTYNSGIFLGKNDINEYNKINWMPAAVIFLFTLLFLLLFNFGIYGYLMALIAGPVSVSLFLLYKKKFIKYFSFDFDWIVIKSLLRLGMIYSLSLFISNLNYKFDLIMLEKLSTQFETGIYAKGANITEFLWQIPMLLSTIVFSKSATSKNRREFSLKVVQLLRITFIFILIGAIILWKLSDFVIMWLFGIEYLKSIQVLNYLLPGVVLLTIFKVLNMDAAGKGKPWLAIYAMTPGLIINIGLNFYFIPIYGSLGAAISSSISYGLSSVIFIMIYSRTFGLSMRKILTFSKNDFKPILEIINRK
jgi:O-antigen/teichoic acid export membrane protein